MFFQSSEVDYEACKFVLQRVNLLSFQRALMAQFGGPRSGGITDNFASSTF